MQLIRFFLEFKKKNFKKNKIKINSKTDRKNNLIFKLKKKVFKKEQVKKLYFKSVSIKYKSIKK